MIYIFFTDELVSTIHSDIEFAKQNLDENSKIDDFFNLLP